MVISACILGEYCRYDGKTKKINAVAEAFKEYEIISFCPEAPLFGTPRERISVVKCAESHRIITDESKIDVTQKLQMQIESFCTNHPNIDAIVLKSKSPSCGYKTTPVLDENKEILYYANGIAADIFLQKYPNIPIKSENDF